MKTKETRGITLIALAVTIAVIIILAGISINAIVGDDGIIQKAQQSANLSNEADAKEAINRAILEFYISKGYKNLEEFLQTKMENGAIDSVEENPDGTLKIGKSGYFVNNIENKTNSSKGNEGNTGGNAGSNTGTVEDKIITLNATSYKGIYDGDSHNVIANISVVPSDTQIEYSTDGTNFSTTIPTITNASSISVTIRASKSGYATKTINTIATVEKAEGKINLSETSGTIDYPDSKTFIVTENTGTLSVLSSNTDVATASINGNTVTINSGVTGTAVITVISAESTNYTLKTAIYSVTVNNSIFTEDSGVGYYADVDNDGTVDGIIFEDFKVGGSGSWGGISYTISTVSNTKNYYICQESYNGPFGTKPVLASLESGKARFYVMALSDYNNGTTYAYTYAEAIISGDWNMPYNALWAAFVKELGITTSNYSKYGLSGAYWSSTYSGYNGRGCNANFRTSGITIASSTETQYPVRFARTF